MFTKLCLSGAISSAQIVIPIRTFKRFGEYVKNYGHEPKYYQGGQFMFCVYLKAYSKSLINLVLGYLPRAPHLKDPPDYLPPFIDPQEWTLEAATFGQNDYIGICFSSHDPVDLLRT